MKDLVQLALERCVKHGAEFSDARILHRVSTSITAQDGRADKMFSSESLGIGVRALIGGAWGFAAINDVSKEAVSRVAEEAAKLARASQRFSRERRVVAEVKPVEAKHVARVKVDPRELPEDVKMKDVLEFEAAARRYDPRIVNTVVSYSDTYSKEAVGNTSGSYVEDEAIRTIISVFVASREGEVRQKALEVRGRLEGYELIQGLTPDELSLRAAKKAIELLKARHAPAGRFTAVLDPHVVGLLAHEAFGHNSEADLVLSGESIVEGMLGQRVASDLVTIIDDATVEGAYGSYAHDSEGTPGQRRIIVEDGILKTYLHSLESAGRLGHKPTGSARAITHQVPPLVRMSNTFIEPGDWSFEEMVEGVKEGLYLKGGYWGYVFTERGQFTCNVQEGYMIKDGELKDHLRDVSFGGLTLETLKLVDAVGKDFKLGIPGMCGKGGQGMFVDGGGPHIRVREVVVGGQL